MYADRMTSRTCPLPRRALAHLRAAMGLAKRRRGGQPGNRNRLTHGLYARTFMARRKKSFALLRDTRALLVEMTNMLRHARQTRRFKRETFRIFGKTAWPPAFNVLRGSHLGRR